MKRLVCLAALLVPCVLHAQRIPPTPRSFVSAITVPAASFRLDTTKVIPRTYWLEGGVIGGVAMGALTVMFAEGMREDNDPHVAADAMAFLIGASVGFPVGALIGGQFPKH